MQVPAMRTVAAPRMFARAFITAWRSMYPDYPTKEQCGVIYAHWMVETGGAACWCWNLGNIKVTQAQVDADVPWFDLPGTWEVVNGERKVLPAGDPGRRFRAYGSLDDAMVQHLSFLRNTRYGPAWRYVEEGDPVRFAVALKQRGYYTAPAEAYAKGMADAFARFRASPVFDDAMRDATAPADRETDPDIVHPDVPLESPELDDDGPPDAA